VYFCEEWPFGEASQVVDERSKVVDEASQALDEALQRLDERSQAVDERFQRRFPFRRLLLPFENVVDEVRHPKSQKESVVGKLRQPLGKNEKALRSDETARVSRVRPVEMFRYFCASVSRTARSRRQALERDDAANSIRLIHNLQLATTESEGRESEGLKFGTGREASSTRPWTSIPAAPASLSSLLCSLRLLVATCNLQPPACNFTSLSAPKHRDPT